MSDGSLHQRGEAELPWVGIVVPNYNKEQYVLETIESVLAQTYPKVDLVVVDDGSTDSSADLVETRLDSESGRMLRLKNGGVSRARNLGFEQLRTDAKYHMFLDSDDLLEPSAIEAFVDHMEANPAASATYSLHTPIDGDGRPTSAVAYTHRWAPTKFGRQRLPEDQAVTPLASMYSRYGVLPSGTLVRRTAFEQTAGWDSNLCRPARPFQTEDKDMAVQLALVGEIHRLPQRLYRYRVISTPHRGDFYQGLQAVDRKWWNAALDGPDLKRVRQAIRFDGTVAVLDAAASWRTSFWTSSLRDKGRLTISVAKAVVRRLTTRIRLRPDE